MAQANIDLIGSTRKCRYCEKTFKSEAGENNHMKRMHPLDMDSDARCWTCNKPFTKRQMLYQHFSTVQPQINCKKFHKGEIPEKEEDLAETKPIGRNSGINRKSAYRRRLMERQVGMHPYVRKPISSLRSTPAIIPLEATMPQADPRTDPKVSFLDLIEIEEEIKEDMKTTKETLKEELQLKTEVRKIQEFEETEDNPETSQIQIQPRSRPETLHAQDSDITLNNPEMNTTKEGLSKKFNAETVPDPETSTEIYQEIYHETRSTAYAALPTPTGSQEELTKKLIHPTQEQLELSKFEESLIEMFNLPQNIKELVPASSPIPDLDLQTALPLPLEENSFLDYLNDCNII